MGRAKFIRRVECIDIARVEYIGTFEIRERRPGYTVEVIPFVIGCLGGGMKKLEEQMAKLIPEELRRLRITREMQKIVLMESETIVGKIISGIVQPE